MLQLSPILQRFVERSPFPVMMRALFERCLDPARLDAWFKSNAEAQYTRQLLFSSLFDLMKQVVLRQKPSVPAAYQVAGGFGDLGLQQAQRRGSGRLWCAGRLRR